MSASITRELEILERLIGFPTVSLTPNLDLIGYVKALFAAVGVEAVVVASEDGARANLHAVVGAAGAGGAMLSGHTDVVPVEGQAWSSDPYRLTRRDDRLFGRGTADMKGFIACTLAAAERAARSPLARPLHLAFSYDEEIGCVGVRRLIDAMEGLAERPALCVVGEPTSMRTVIAHKGKVAGKILCAGHACHSSHAPEGLNAIHLAVDMVQALRALQADIEARGARDDDFTVPFTTVHAGVIRGGAALNIVPSDCVVDFEIRSLPTDDPARHLDRLFAEAARLTAAATARFPETGVRIEIVNDYPGLDTAPESAAARDVARFAGVGGFGKIAFGTEGGLFAQRLGIPTVVCGPGDIAQAHKPDEFVALDQLAACAATLDRLVESLRA